MGNVSEAGVTIKLVVVPKSLMLLKKPLEGLGALLYFISMHATDLLALTRKRSVSAPVSLEQNMDPTPGNAQSICKFKTIHTVFMITDVNNVFSRLIFSQLDLIINPEASLRFRKQTDQSAYSLMQRTEIPLARP